MSRLLSITDLGSGIMVQGTDNVLYPDNATLTYPYNSIIVVTDESDIATFRSASNNDVLFSGLIGNIEIGGEIVTKENINVKFDAIANQSSGGGGDVSGLFANASYDSQTKRINFYDKDNNIVSYIDATDFIKDGMVSNVEILNGNLVITFNTDAGKQPITIPLTDIFNPANYYDKTSADSTFATQVVVNEEIAARIQGDSAINAALQTKADKSEIPDTSDFVTKTEYNPKEVAIAEALTDLNENKADKSEIPVVPDMSNYYTKTETDNTFLSQEDFDEKEEVIATSLNDLQENKQDTLTAGTGISIQNNVISATGGDGGALFVDFDDLTENMNDDKWDELVDALQNNKPIFSVHNGSEGDITDIEQFPVDGYVYINQTEGEEEANIELRQLYNGGWDSVNIIKNGSEDYEVTDNGGGYQPLLQAGSGITIDSDNVISASITVDSALTQNSTNAVENSAIYDKVTMEVGDDTVEYDSEPVTSTTSGSRYYKVHFNDAGQSVSFTVEGEDGMVLDDTGIMKQMGIPVSDSIVTVNRYEVQFGTGYEVVFSDEYNVESVSANGGAGFYVGHKVTNTEWVKDVVADLMDEVDTKVNNLGGVTNIVKISSADYEALATKDNNTLYVITTN